MAKEKPAFYAILPATVRYDDRLRPGDVKVLYAEITALTTAKGYCFASDTYFANLFDVSKTTVQHWLKVLEECGYITRTKKYREGTKEILGRYIRIIKDPTQEILSNPTQEILRDSITSINNTRGNKSPENKKPIFDTSTPAYQLAKFLEDQIKNNMPDFEAKNIQTWANDARLMLEKDKRKFEEAQRLMVWCQADDFWRGNIMSMSKFRQKFAQLYVQAKPKTKQRGQNRESLPDWSQPGYKQEHKPVDPEEAAAIKAQLAKLKKQQNEV